MSIQFSNAYVTPFTVHWRYLNWNKNIIVFIISFFRKKYVNLIEYLEKLDFIFRNDVLFGNFVL